MNRRPSTLAGRQAAAAKSEARIADILTQAEARGWRPCGDLMSQTDRRSHYFKALAPEKRFALSCVIADSGCWEWVGGKKPNGYGQFHFGNFNTYAHRVAYILFVGPVRAGLTIDHLCMNKGCVNPKHLDLVTPAENTQRWARTITHCPAGHEYTAENTMLKRGTRRNCRACHNERTGLKGAERRAAAQATRPPKIRLLDSDIEVMRGMRTNGLAVRDIAAIFNVTPKYASAVMSGSRKRRAKHTGPNVGTVQLLQARSGGQCEFVECQRPAVHTHHRKPRRLGGSTDPAINLPPNLVRLCAHHHQWVESNRLEALAMGLLLHANDVPSETPVLLGHGLLFLTVTGGYADAPSERAA